MRLQNYSQAYATQPLPENEQRKIKGWGMLLFGLEILFVAWCLAVKVFLIPEIITTVVIYALAFAIVVLFAIAGAMLYQAYYTFWCTPFSLGIPLRLGLVFGGAVSIWLFNFVAFIFLLVFLVVIIPQQKLQREALVKAHRQGADEMAPGQTLPAMPTVNAGANKDCVARGTGGGYGLPVTLAVISALNILLSGQFVMEMAGSLSASYEPARGAAVALGWIMLLPGMVIGIVFFFVARARVRLMRKYGVSESGVMMAYVVLEFLAAVSVLPFVIFCIYSALALQN